MHLLILRSSQTAAKREQSKAYDRCRDPTDDVPHGSVGEVTGEEVAPPIGHGVRGIYSDKKKYHTDNQNPDSHNLLKFHADSKLHIPAPHNAGVFCMVSLFSNWFRAVTNICVLASKGRLRGGQQAAPGDMQKIQLPVWATVQMDSRFSEIRRSLSGCGIRVSEDVLLGTASRLSPSSCW